MNSRDEPTAEIERTAVNPDASAIRDGRSSESCAETPKTLGGYEIIERIDAGASGVVYKARAMDGTVVALKVLSQELTSEDVCLLRFRREAAIAVKIRHPNIVGAMEFGEDRDQHFLAMEFVEGENLGNRLAREGRLAEDEVLRIILELSRGVHTAHKQCLVHRDIKPDNVLLGEDGAVKLADLGLAKPQDADFDLTRTGQGLGTLPFIAPEQLRDAKRATTLCDIYSMGATLYAMATGLPPFRGSLVEVFDKKRMNEFPDPAETNPDVDRRVLRAIRRAMASDPKQRPGSVQAFAALIIGTMEAQHIFA